MGLRGLHVIYNRPNTFNSHQIGKRHRKNDLFERDQDIRDGEKARETTMELSVPKTRTARVPGVKSGLKD
jgi:hypothetical protein